MARQKVTCTMSLADDAYTVLQVASDRHPRPAAGFKPLAEEGAIFAESRLAAYESCAEELQRHVEGVLSRLNQKEFENINAYLRRSTRALQHAWRSDADTTPPYAEVPAALVHTGCSLADTELTMRQLLRSLRTDCSPHVAVLRSKECGTLTSAVSPEGWARVCYGSGVELLWDCHVIPT